MENILIIAVLLVIVGCAVAYVVKEKKKGVKCIGCPNAKKCSMAEKQRCNGMCDFNEK